MSTRTIERIVLALEPTSDNRIAIATAVTLARQLGVTLEGVFVEDINLLHYSSLPFARIVRHGSLRAEPIDPEHMEQALRKQARRLQRLVNEIASQSQFTAAFTTLRGDVIGSLRSVSAPRDLLIINRAADVRHPRQLGRTARGLMSAVAASVLLLHPVQAMERPVVVLFDGTPQGLRALQLAMQLAQEDEQHLSVLYPATAADQARQLRGAVNDQLAATGIQAKHITLSVNTADELCRRFTQSAGRILLLDAPSPYLEPAAYESIALTLSAPLLLVR